MVSTKVFRVAVGGIVLLSGTSVAAEQQSVDLAKIRQQLTTIRSDEGAREPERFDDDTTSGETFAVDTTALDSTNSDLINAENALIKKIDGGVTTFESPSGGRGGKKGGSGYARVTVKEEAPAKYEPPVLKAAVSEDGMTAERFAQQEAVVETLRASLIKAEARAKDAEARSDKVSKQLSDARNRLMVAETEVERLSSVLQERNRTTLSQLAPTTQNTPRSDTTSRARMAPQSEASATTRRAAATEAVDMPVATVVSEKAFLRSGPGRNNSPLMSVSNGTRLVVETREGEWYRVITPTGSRAWVASDVVAFGGESKSGSSRTIRVKGYESPQ